MDEDRVEGTAEFYVFARSGEGLATYVDVLAPDQFVSRVIDEARYVIRVTDLLRATEE